MPFHKLKIESGKLKVRKILNSQLSILNSPGFTLVEFLVVLGILAVVIGSSLLFLTTMLRGSNQSNITAEVKQNGQAALEGLDGQIRNGRDVRALVGSEIPSGSSNAISVNLVNGKYLHVACFNTVDTTSNGWIGTAETLDAIAPTGQTPYIPLTNKDILSGVDIVCGSAGTTFQVTSATTGALSPAIVSITFLVNQAVGAPSRQDFKANVEFRTTISLRRY